METKELMIVYGVIYKCTNLINGKIYIGQTKNLKNRIKMHKKNVENKVNRKLYDSMNKHGFENFKWEVIDVALSKEELNFKEKFYIIKFNSFNSGYNMTIGGDGGNTFEGLSKERQIEAGNKIRKALKGKKKPDGFAEKLSKIHKGKKMPEYGIEKNRLNKIYNSDKNSQAVKKGLSKRTEEEKRIQFEKRKQTMLNRSQEEIRISKEKTIKSLRHPVVCIETGVVYKNKKYASIDVYGQKEKTTWISKSIENGKQYLGYSWSYFEEDIFSLLKMDDIRASKEALEFLEKAV